MKKIPLGRSGELFTIIDDEDFPEISKNKWSAFKHGKTYYAQRRKVIGGKQTRIWMHHVILPRKSGVFTDHRDGNGWNNRKSNLRYCTHSENCVNREWSKSGKTSQFRGVCWDKSNSCWRATLKKLGEIFYELCTDEEEAAISYNEMAVLHHGEFARLNIIP